MASTLSCIGGLRLRSPEVPARAVPRAFLGLPPAGLLPLPRPPVRASLARLALLLAARVVPARPLGNDMTGQRRAQARSQPFAQPRRAGGQRRGLLRPDLAQRFREAEAQRRPASFSRRL